LKICRVGGPVWLSLAGDSDVKAYLERTLIPRL
jgi:hypothetical protein